MSDHLPRVRRGERHPNAVLTRSQINAARALVEQEDLPLSEIIRRLSLPCAPETLRRALRGETYRDG